MTVDLTGNDPGQEHEGHVYHFCTERCRAKFADAEELEVFCVTDRGARELNPLSVPEGERTKPGPTRYAPYRPPARSGAAAMRSERSAVKSD